MKVIFSGPAAAFDTHGKHITDPSILLTINGLEYTEEVCATHLNEPLSEIGLTGGGLRIIYDAATQTLNVHTEYLSPRKLKSSELTLLRDYTLGQWSDGIGEGCFDSYQEETGITVSVYPLPYDNAVVQISQIDEGSKPPKRSPLLAAAKKGDVKKLQTLLDKGESIDAIGQWQHTPLISAVCSNHTEAAIFLISRGANVNQKADEAANCMQSASMHGNVALLSALIKAGANVEEKDARGATPLMWAANRGHPDAVTFLLQNGANLNAQDAHGRTSLMYAAADHPDILMYLLNKGADTKIRSTEGLTAAEEASRQAAWERKSNWARAELIAQLEAKAALLEQFKQ